jgi:hypothetical protein
LKDNEIKSIGFSYLPYETAIEKYDPQNLKDGFNILTDGEEIFYISKPAIGLWAG